jgi:prepilin-type N-terminal cleavage/methylation domain-containing protein
MNSATKNNPINKNEKGFSLLEVIFAMAIIASGIISILSLFSYNLKAETNNKNKLIATYLAQEGIEVVRQIRDNIWFGSVGDGDNEFLDEDGLGFKDGNFVVEPFQKNNLPKGFQIMNNTDETIYKKNSGGSDYYIQWTSGGSGGAETGFTRYLEIADNSDGLGPAVPGCDISSCVRIISHVSFNGVELATITAYLYDDWYN